MSTFYSGWVGGDDWRIRVDVGTSSPAMSTTGTVSVHVAIENVYARYSASASVTISCAGQSRTVSTTGVTGSGTFWAPEQSFVVGRGHSPTGVMISVSMAMPSSATGAYRAGTSCSGSVSLDPVTSNTFTYDAEGGTVQGGATWSNTKWYGEHYYVPTLSVSRAGFQFLGWSRVEGGQATLWAGSEITDDVALTLHAAWRRSYVAPTIGSVTAKRSDSSGSTMEEGTYAKVSAAWSVDTAVTSGNEVSKVTVATRERGAASWSDEHALTAGGTTSGTATGVVGTFDVGKAYDVRVTVTDKGGQSVAFAVLGPSFQLVDLLRGGRGLAIGKKATREGLDVAMGMYRSGVPMLPVLYYESTPAESALPVKPCLVAVKGGGLYLAE